MALPARARALALRLVVASTPEAVSAELLICLACGTELPAPLARTGSLRCHDCRSESAPLEPWLVSRQQTLSRDSSRRR